MSRLAADGLPARVGGPWSREKLVWLQRYAAAFMKAMAAKRRQGKWEKLVYIDLLAGPGRGLDRDTGDEFDGSPVRALKVVPPFDHLYFGDLNPRNIDALRRRVSAADRSGRVTILRGDCNMLAGQVVGQLSRRTLGLAFVDPEGFEATFEMFRTLASRQIDVLLLFPSGIGIARNLRRFAKRQESPMDRLWGGREWRDLPAAKVAAGRRLSPEEFEGLDKPWVERFRRKMATIGFEFQDEADPCFRNEKNVPMYHLLFFARHPAGLTIWRNIKRVEPSGQRTLF